MQLSRAYNVYEKRRIFYEEHDAIIGVAIGGL